MRILSIMPFSPPSREYGGAERQVHSLHRGLLAHGVDIHVLADIALVGKQYQEFEGVHVWGASFPDLTSNPLRPGNLKLWTAWQSVRKLVHSQVPRPDIIQAVTFRQPAMIGSWLAKSLDLPWVARLAASGTYGDFAFAKSNWLTRMMLPKMVRSVSRVIALDAETRREAVASGVSDHRIEIIRNAVLLQGAVQGRRRGESGFLFVGRLARQKRVACLLEAYSRLLQSNTSSPELVIAGDGDQRASLESAAARMGIASRCSFLGQVSGPEDALAEAACLINPSESEGFPNAVLEALAYGVPVLLSDIPVHRDIATAVGMQDFLFAVGDASELARKMNQFLLLDTHAKEILAERCKKYAAPFSPAVRDAAYLGMYRRVLSERRDV